MKCLITGSVNLEDRRSYDSSTNAFADGNVDDIEFNDSDDENEQNKASVQSATAVDVRDILKSVGTFMFLAIFLLSS